MSFNEKGFIQCPCKGCKDRFVGCHASCPGYKAFKDENERIRELIQRERIRDDWSRGKYHG